jgi:hypothetical protein
LLGRSYVEARDERRVKAPRAKAGECYPSPEKVARWAGSGIRMVKFKKQNMGITRSQESSKIGCSGTWTVVCDAVFRSG